MVLVLSNVYNARKDIMESMEFAKKLKVQKLLL